MEIDVPGAARVQGGRQLPGEGFCLRVVGCEIEQRRAIVKSCGCGVLIRLR
jgi:hypothetical protein